MEAVPRLPMISFDLKVSPDRQPTDFGKLKQYIRDFYHEDPESYSGEIHKLEALRASAIRPVNDVTGCSVLKKYYCQLHFLQSRFPMGKDGAAAINFTWKDTYANMVCTLADIRFEIVSVLYNIGALHSQLGATDGRATAEGLKLACTHFQCAAWAFQHLKDTYPQPAGVDLSPDLMQFMYQVCLAQAQECILEKSMTDNRKATINAKVAAQIVDYYNMALNALSHGGSDDGSVLETVGSKLFKSWKRYVKFKLTYYGCISLLYQGQQSEEQQKMGERMAYYQAAFDKLVDATKITKGLDHPEVIEEALTFTMDVVEGKRKAAKNENEFIYHEEVPDKDALPEIKGAALVKGIPFSVNDTDISGPDIFSRLVPMKAHEASSLYSEEKAKLLRKVGAMIDEKDQALVSFMSALQLECVNAHLEPQDRIPQDIVDRCAALSAKPDAIQNLIQAMDKLSDVYHDVEAMLKEVMELIQNEEVEEKEYQEVMGSRPPSIVATDLTREAKKYEEAHMKAAESNKTLHKAMTLHIANLRLLELPLPELAKQIPTLTPLNLDQQPVVKEMQHLVGKVEEMRRQRAMLATQLRESICSDDITTQLITRQQDNLNTIFQEELQKHNKYVTLIEQNLAAQDNILKALTDTYGEYSPVRKATMEIIKQRNMTLSALISSYDAYEDLIAKSNKGLEFYRKLETNMTKLLQRVKGTCKVQQEERDTILAKNHKTLPSKSKTVPSEVSNSNIPTASVGGPKLKDYLENFKRDKSSGYAAPSASGAMTDSYFSPGTQPPSYLDSVSAPYDNSQNVQPWVPSVRPAPVGQEGTCPSPATQDMKPETSYPGYPTYTAANKPYGSDATQFNQGFNDQYAAYMNQYQQYNSSTSSPYHLPANYSKNDPSMYSKTVSNPNAVSYPNNAPSPQIQAGSQSSQVPMYPNPSPSPVANYSQTYDAYKVPTTNTYNMAPTTLPQTYTAVTPTTLSQAYNAAMTPSTLPQIYNAPQQYNNQTYQPASLQNAGYTQKVGSTQESLPSNYQHMNQQYPASTGVGYSAHNIPQVPNFPSNTPSPQHNYPLANNMGTAQNVNPNIQPYQNTMSTYMQTPANQSQYFNSQTSVDQSISDNFATLQNKQADLKNTTYPTQYPVNYLANNLQEKQQTGGPQPYTQYPAGGQNSSYLYSSLETNTSGTQSALSQPANANLQHSNYIPQNYTAYESNEQYRLNNSGVEPWQSGQQPIPADYYRANTHPNYLQTPKQYTPATAASFYTHAGQSTSQTSASTPQTINQVGQPNYTQGNYYYHPYGYQYTTGAQSTVVYETPSQSPRVCTGQSSSTPQGQIAPQSPMTYMQASNSTSNLKLTFSQDTKGSLDDKSNVDLLAGLDFSVSQDPLVPQQKPSEPIVKTPSKPSVPEPKEVEQSLASMTLSDVTPSPTPSQAAPTPEPGSLTPKKISEDRSKFYLRDPFSDTETLNQFAQEVEKFEKFVEGLTVKTLNGPTPLDIKWKELLDLQEKDSIRHSISVARCYPVKNRFSDILPYDDSRVELPSTKDDYINASFVKDVAPNFPDSIVTQLPLAATFGDFWTMVLEQQVELIVCLLNDSEMENSVYWPVEKGVEMVVGRVKLSLQSSNTCQHWVERIIYVTDSRLARVVVHLQFTQWPGSSFPSSPGPFLSLVSEALSVLSQQRGSGPCVVHCLSGVGRSGLFLLATAAICHIHAARPSVPSLPDLPTLAANIANWRKNAMRDREHFKFAYLALLYYSQDLLMKRGILASRSSFEDKRTKSHTRHPSEDFLLGPPKDVSQPHSNPEKEETGGGSRKSSTEAADPLSQLDPLWSLKR